MVYPDDPALQDAEKTLDRIGVNLSFTFIANVLLAAMVHNVMGSESLDCERVDGEIVSHNLRLGSQVLFHNRPEILGSYPLDVERPRTPIAFDKRHDRRLVAIAPR